MECEVVETGGSVCTLDRTHRTLRFASRQEAVDEVKKLAAECGFVLKVRTSTERYAYLECGSGLASTSATASKRKEKHKHIGEGEGEGRDKCRFQAKVHNTSRNVNEAWAIQILEPHHYHTISPPRLHTPRPLPTAVQPHQQQHQSANQPIDHQNDNYNVGEDDRDGTAWFKARRTEREMENDGISALTDPRVWRRYDRSSRASSSSSSSNGDDGQHDKDGGHKPAGAGSSDKLANHFALAVAGDGTGGGGMMVQKGALALLLDAPLHITLKALETIAQQDTLLGELTHQKIKQLQSSVSQLELQRRSQHQRNDSNDRPPSKIL